MSEMPRLFPGQTTLFSPAGEQQEPELPRLSPSVKPPQVLEAEAAKNLHLTRGEKAASVAQDLAVANQLGVDPGLVGRNRDELYSRADTEAAIATLADAPALSEFMAQDRINTILAKDELGLLASLEREFKSGLDRMSVSYDVGNLYAEELIQLRYAQNMGDESPETQARVDAVKAKIKAIQPAEPNNLWERFMGVLGQQTPIQEEIIGSSVQGALEGALVGGTVGAVGGGPLAPVGASAGAAVGAGAGAVARTVETSFRLETGSAFDEFLDSGMDKETARWASRTYGALASAIETITVPVKAIPGVGQLSQAAMSAPKAALRNTIKGAVLRFLGGATKMQVGEAAEEALQTITQDVIKSAGQMFDGTVVTGSVEETLDNAFNAAIDSLLYPLGAGMQTPQLTVDLYSVRAQRLFEEQAAARTRITGLLNGQLEAAQVDEDMLRLDTLRRAATQSTLRQADPARFEQLIAAQVETSKTNITEVFISGEAFAAAVQSVSPEEVGPLFQALGLTMDTVNEAVATGADVTVAMSKYMAHMAGTQLDTALVNDIRTRANGMTVNEREAWLAESQDELAKLADEAKTARERNQILDTEAAQIEEAITNEIDMTTSVATKAVAPQLATIWSSFFTTLASRGFLDTSHEGSAWKAFRTVWPDVRSDTWQNFQRQKEAGRAIVDQQALQQDAAYAGVENEAEVEEAGRLWAEMGTESPYFKRWSGGAPVVLKNAAPSFTTGQAVVVEADHGAPDIRFVQEDGVFKSEKERYGFGRSEAAHWFTRDTATAKTYADPRRAFDYQNAEPGVIPAYVRLDNPLVIDAAGQNWRDAQKRGKTSDVIAEARAKGHDGVIIYNVKDDYNNDKKTRPTTTLTVFSSTQIKSVNNRGTFDPTDARILNQSLSPEAQAMADRISQALNQPVGPEPDAEVAVSPTLYQVQNLPEWKVKTRTWMEKNGYTAKEIEKHLGAIEGQMKIFAALGPMELEMLPKGAGLAKRYTKDGVPYEGPLRENVDPIYKITFDASAMCVKRLEAAATANYVQAKIGRALTTSERMALVALFRSAGKAAPCIYCYVEAPRAKSGEFVKTATDVVFGVQDTPKHTSGKKKGQEKWSAATLSKARAAQEEAKALGLSPSDVDPNVLLDPEYAQTEEAKAKEAAAPAIYKFLRSQQLNAKSNLPKLYEEYDGQILGLPQELLDELNGYAGLRFFSSSDFQAEHVADLMQAVFDMEIRQAKAHAYTKVPDFVRIFGGTGIKIQTSVFAKEVNGEIVMDDWQGMNWDDAKAFREQYDNVGTVLVATSDAIVLWAKQQDWIDYIIPFHWSGLEKKFYTSMDWQDFTSTQTEQPLVDGATIKKIRMHETGSAAGISNEQGTRNYLTLAMERGIVPVFPAFLFKDFQPSGDRAADAKNAKARWELMAKSGEIDWDMIDPEYYKLRKDYARTDTPFRAVQANIDVNMAEDILNMFLAGETPRAQVDQMIAERLMGMIRESETTGADIGVDALKRVKEGQTLFQQQSPLGFVSAVETAITGMDFKTMPGKDLANRVKKTAGIKGEELEDLGLIEWLEGAGKVTKDQVLEFVRNGGPQIEEVVKGRGDQGLYTEETEDGWGVWDKNDNFIDGYATEAEALSAIEDFNESGPDNTNFSLYTMPGGENYREVLMTLPDARRSKAREVIDAAARSYEEGVALEEKYGMTYKEALRIQRSAPFTSSHWSEPNVIAHMRLNDRVDAEGKRALFIEEIQSDWHQAGRKKGYSQELVDGKRTAGVPNAPFKKSWSMLAFKRVLRMAAEQGYDSVAWTPGEVQVERYDLSKQVERILYSPYGDGTYEMGATLKNGQEIPGASGRMDAAKIADTFGKEIADKIERGEKQGEEDGTFYLEGDGLKVGGEGMKGFYDKILPAEVNKYAKKWGVKAAPGTVSGQQVWTLPITDQMRQDILQGQPLYQQQDQANAAVDLTAGPSGTPIVTLFETANESSFLHESGHIFVRFIQQIAQQPGASQELKDLWSAIAKEIGHEGRGPIQVEAHEKFARALEVYFAEGKAPSKEMIPVFAAFATWLKRLYTTLFMKGHKPSPELAALFDRLFATDDQIAEREAAHEAARPFFVSAEAMLEAEREAYGKLRKRAEETARDKALRQMTKAYVTALGGKKQFTADAKAEADKLPVYRAADFIAANGGLNILDVDNLVGEETRKALGKKLRVGSLTKSGTLDPDQVAKDHGYQNAEVMLQALLDAEPKGRYIKRVSDEKMAEKREVLERGMADDAAEEHYHSDERLAVLIAETEMLRASQARAAGQTARKAKAIELAAVREVARAVIKQKTVSKASSYKSFLRAELAASKKARRAVEAGDTVEAEKWKRQEMLNHALVLEAIDARERVEKGKARLERQRKNGKADEDVRDMLTDIAIRFGLVTRPPKVSLADSVAAYNKWLNEKGADGKPRKVIDFGAWAAEQESKGYGTQISPLVSDRSQMADYRDLTLAEFEDILGSANHIATIESRERTIKVGDKWVEVEEVVNALIAQMQMTRDAKQRSQFNPKWYMKFLEADASLEKMELLFKSLDGGTLGPFYEYFMDRVNKAKEREDDMMLKAANDLTGMMAKHYTFSERQALFGKRILVKEIGESITKAQLLRVLLDFGNEGNYMRRRDGNGWTDEQMEALKAYADKRDWDYIQEVWNYLDTYRPEAFQVHKDLTGATPEQIMPREVQTPYGVYAGGYFPSVIDKKYNTTAQARQQIENAMLYGTPNFAHAMTKHGHTKARMQSAGGQALSIELSDLTDHVFGVIHDITHRAAVMDVAKIIRHKDFNREAIAYMGKEVYDQLTPWIKDIANSPLEPATFPEKAFRAVRMGTTVARLAKIGVGLQQIAGLTQSVAQLKGDAGKLLKVLGTYMINPKRMLTDIAFANESSAFMRHRITSTTREAADTFRGLTLQGKAMAEPGRMMMRFMGACQKFGTDVPTWRAAYDAELSRRSNENMAAIDAHKRAVEYADHIVRISQGSGDIKDLTQIQRSKSEMVKAITMFYSFLASAYAQMVHPLRGKKVHLAHFMLTTTMLAIIGPSLAEILSGRPPEDEDEDGEADWDIWVAKNSLQFGLSLVPGVKDVLGSAASGFGYNMTPIESPIRDLVWLLRNTPDVVANEEYEKLIKPGANVFGVLFKFPSDQVLITGTAAYKLLQDDPDYGYLDLIYKRRKE